MTNKKRMNDPLMVDIQSDGSIGITKFDESLASKCVTRYHSADDLPLWLQERLAALMILDESALRVEGLGMRVTTNVYWIDHNGEYA